MIVHKPHLMTKVQIWSPRYHDKFGDTAEPVVLIAKYKVHHGSSVLLVEFTKAKHLLGQRYCITRDAAQRYPVETNGKIECYAVPLSAFEGWQSASEARDLAFEAFE